MAVITNRAAKLIIEGLEYPGFISFSGQDSAIDQSGLVQFQATIEIGDHHLNPEELKPRINRFWGFGKKLEIFIQNKTKEWVLHPRGTVWLYTSFYDPTTRILNIQCGCLIFILKNRSTDDFESPEDIVNTEQTGIDPETNEEIVVEKDKYWWQAWQEPGKIDIEDIVAEVLTRLGLQKIGRPIGQIRLPWQPSGSLLQAIGGLCFKSVAPSYLWCDNKGKIRVERLYARKGSANVAYTASGNFAVSPGLLWEFLPTFENKSDVDITIGRDSGGEIKYGPFDPGLEPIKELLVTGRWKEESDAEIDTLEGAFKNCESYIEEGAESLILPGGRSDFDITIARGERCEYTYLSKKVVKEWRDERRKLLFPDTRYAFDKWVRMRETEVTQFFDPANNNRLYRELEITKECNGKIFGAFFQNNSDISVTGITNAKTIYTDALAHDTGLQVSVKKETLYFYDIDLSLKEKKTTTYEPQSKILDNYVLFSEDLKITRQEIEKWGANANNKNYQKSSKICWKLYDSNEIEKLDKRLYKEQNIVSVTILPGYEREGHFEESNLLIPISVTVPTPVVLADQRFALISERNQQKLSTENAANPPATEYLPTRNINNNTEVNLKDVGGFVLKTWKDNTDRRPPREILDLGDVWSQQVINMVGEFVYFLRQGNSQVMRVEIPLTEKIINDYKPFMKISIAEYSGEIVDFLLDGSVFDVGEKNCTMSSDCLWLGTSGQAQVATLSENQWITIAF